jgi:lipopolysaccharide transport system ATP-binding protein
MTTAAVRVEGLGKRYALAGSQHGRPTYRTLRESVTDGIGAAAQRLRGRRAASREFWALADVSLEVEPGQVLGIVGRNGAGKSTLLKILSRITRPTTGRVILNGRVGSLLEVGTGFHPELTGRENVYLNGSILGMSRREIDRKFADIVEFAEVEKFLDTPVKRYSSGMYVRLAFAVAAHLDPEILIVDEVLAVGDAQFQKKCLDRMKDVSTDGRTILFVSHNLPALENLCDSGVLLSGGRVAAYGPIREVLAEYSRHEKVGDRAEVDLSAHSNVRGRTSGNLRRLSMTSDGQSTASVRMGETLEIAVEYQCHIMPADPKIGLTIEDGRGVKVVSFAPSFQAPNLLRSVPPRGVFTAKIPVLNLVEGYYSVNVYYEDGVESESVEGACELEVIAADVFDTGRIPGPQHGVTYLQAQWSVEPVDGEE